MMFNAELAARVPAPPTANCLDPGTVNTKMLIQGAEHCTCELLLHIGDVVLLSGKVAG